MLISDLSSYVCSSDLADARLGGGLLRPRHPWPQVLEALVDGRHRSTRPLGAEPPQRHAVGEVDTHGWRTEERRVVAEGGRTCSYRGWPYTSKKNTNTR